MWSRHQFLLDLIFLDSARVITLLEIVIAANNVSIASSDKARTRILIKKKRKSRSGQCRGHYLWSFKKVTCPFDHKVGPLLKIFHTHYVHLFLCVVWTLLMVIRSWWCCCCCALVFSVFEEYALHGSYLICSLLSLSLSFFLSIYSSIYLFIYLYIYLYKIYPRSLLQQNFIWCVAYL